MFIDKFFENEMNSRSNDCTRDNIPAYSVKIGIYDTYPLIPYRYNTSDGFHWSDTDGDHIPDVVESMLNNASHFLEFYNFTHYDDWMKDYRIALWNDYEWSIAYYYALLLHKRFDKLYSKLEGATQNRIQTFEAYPAYNESCVENATKYLTTQYNPLVVENMAPVIAKFTVKFHYYYITALVDVHVTVLDVGEVNSVVIKDDDFAQSAKWSGASKKVELEHTFWASPWGANLGVNITVIGKDWRGNRAKISRYVEGPVGKALEMLWSLLPAWLRHTLMRMAKEMASAVNFIVEWIWGKIKEVFNKAIAPLFSFLEGYKQNIVYILQEVIDEYNNTGDISISTLDDIVDILLEPIETIMWILVAVQSAIMVFSIFSGGLGLTLSSLIITLFIITVIGAIKENVIDCLSPPVTSIREVWVWILEKFEVRNFFNNYHYHKNTFIKSDFVGIFINIASIILAYITIRISVFLASKGVTIIPLVEAGLGSALIVMGSVLSIISVIYPSIWVQKLVFLIQGTLSIIGTLLIVTSLLGWESISSQISRYTTRAFAEFYLCILILSCVVGLISAAYNYWGYISL